MDAKPAPEVSQKRKSRPLLRVVIPRRAEPTRLLGKDSELSRILASGNVDNKKLAQLEKEVQRRLPFAI